MLETAQVAVHSNPQWKDQFKRLAKRMHWSKAMMATARWMLVSIQHLLTKREPKHHFDKETIAYIVLTPALCRIWGWALDELRLEGLKFGAKHLQESQNNVFTFRKYPEGIFSSRPSPESSQTPLATSPLEQEMREVNQRTCTSQGLSSGTAHAGELPV